MLLGCSAQVAPALASRFIVDLQPILSDFVMAVEDGILPFQALLDDVRSFLVLGRGCGFCGGGFGQS